MQEHVTKVLEFNELGNYLSVKRQTKNHLRNQTVKFFNHPVNLSLLGCKMFSNSSLAQE